MNHKASGSQNRKRRKEVDALVSGLPKLTTFMPVVPRHGFPGGSAFTSASAATAAARDVFWGGDNMEIDNQPLSDPEPVPAPIEDTFELELSNPEGKIYYVKF